MKKHIYGVFNIESDNFSFNEHERNKYCPEIYYAHSGAAYYRIAATWFQYLYLRFKFWKLRHSLKYKVRIRKLED